MKHWPAVTQQVRRVARADLKQVVFRGHALNHHAVLPLTALDGAPAHSMYNSLLLFRAFTVVLWSSIAANAHLWALKTIFHSYFPPWRHGELLNDTKLLKKLKRGKITEEEFEKGLLTSGKRSMNTADLVISDLKDECRFPPLRWNTLEWGKQGAGPHPADSSSFLLLNIRASAAVGELLFQKWQMWGVSHSWAFY